MNQENEMACWSCKIGEVPSAMLNSGADGPMREAVARAFKELTGFDAEFIFSGWGARLDEGERAVVEGSNDPPADDRETLGTVEFDAALGQNYST